MTITYEKITHADRDYGKNPMTAREAIYCFEQEMFELVMAGQPALRAAAKVVGDDIHARHDDYLEELRCLMAEL